MCIRDRVGVVVKLFCKVISAVVEKVGGVHIKDQLTVAESVLFDACLLYTSRCV